jgi:hypothetical protein
MSKPGWQKFLAADGVDDWVVLHGGAAAVFRVPTMGDAARLAAAIATVPSIGGSGALLTVADGRLGVRLSRPRVRRAGGGQRHRPAGPRLDGVDAGARPGQAVPARDARRCVRRLRTRRGAGGGGRGRGRPDRRQLGGAAPVPRGSSCARLSSCLSRKRAGRSATGSGGRDPPPNDDVVHAGSGQDALYLAKRVGRRKVAPGASNASITSSMTARVPPTSRMFMTKS